MEMWEVTRMQLEMDPPRIRIQGTYKDKRHRYAHPFLRIRGQWMRDCGFEIDAVVELRLVGYGQLLVQRVKEGDEGDAG